jgi:integrase
MAFAGLRVGEAAAITRRDVHGDRLTVDKQISELSRQVAPVKSAEASIIIPVWLAERLDSVTDTAQPASIRESLRRAGHKVGIHLSPHQLRHWYATTLLSRGVPLITVSRQMRHSDVSVTLRTYAQADDARSIHDAFS